MLAWILAFTLLGSVGGVLGAAGILLLSDRIRRRLVSLLVAFAVGALIGAALLGMVPHAAESLPLGRVLHLLVAGLVTFFILEKIIRALSRHEHPPEEHALDKATHAPGVAPAGPLILIGDGVHNFVDGLVVAAAFLTSVPLGIATGLAVLAHEIPHEVGDFAILLESGFSRARALAFNVLSGMTAPLGGVVGWLALDALGGMSPYLLAFAAGGFVYIAVADLVPALHSRIGFGQALAQVTLILVGAGMVSTFHGRSHGHDAAEDSPAAVHPDRRDEGAQ
jgi:zinc and cadmium transporter